MTGVLLQECLLLVPLDDDVLRDEELDKELLWNLQLLSEVSSRACMSVNPG